MQVDDELGQDEDVLIQDEDVLIQDGDELRQCIELDELDELIELDELDELVELDELCFFILRNFFLFLWHGLHLQFFDLLHLISVVLVNKLEGAELLHDSE
jgi:hypothetical protein